MKAREIAEIVGGIVSGDADVEITGLASVERAGAADLTFAEGTGPDLKTAAGCVIIPTGSSTEAGIARIEVAQPKLAFAKAARSVKPRHKTQAGIHPNAVIAASASIAEGVSIGPHSVVGDGSHIGERTEIGPGVSIGRGVNIGTDCVLHPNVVVEDGCEIGSSVILHAGAVIGADGFGYVKDGQGEYLQFPQVGGVVIEDNVEIGANSCVDRGSLGVTRIGAGTKIDNLVQIAHNVEIGKRVVIAAQTGISGSTVIEDDCVIGGQVGMGDHARVLSGAVIGSQAGVLPGKIVRAGVWWGTPVQPLDEYKRQNAMVKGLSRLREEVKELRRKLAEKP